MKALVHAMILTSIIVECRLMEDTTKSFLKLFTHPKLMGTYDLKHRSDHSSPATDEFIVHFYTKKVTNATMVMEQLTRGSSVKIMEVFDDKDLKGALISGVSNNQLKSILDSDYVEIATRNLITYMDSNAGAVEKTQFNVTWNLDRLSSPYGDGQYKYKYDGTGVIVYVFGNGATPTHEEFGGRASCAYSYNDDGCVDENGVSTSVASVVGGKTYGVAKNVTIKFIKNNPVGSKDVVGEIFRSLKAIRYIFRQKRKNPNTPTVVLLNVITPTNKYLDWIANRMAKAGLISITGVSYSGKDACLYSPLSAESSIVVGYTNESDTRSRMQDYGKCVDIYAPGINIKGAYKTNDTSTIVFSGSPWATAHVAGVVAMYLQKNPKWKTPQVKAALLRDSIPNIIKFLNESYIPKPDLSPNLFICADNITNS